MGDALRSEQQERWRRNDRVSIEALVERCPEIRQRPDELMALIASEIALREACGELPQLDDYSSRFPQCAELLRQTFATRTPAAAWETLVPTGNTKTAAPQPATVPDELATVAPASDHRLSASPPAPPPTSHELATVAPSPPASVTPKPLEAVAYETIASDPSGAMATASVKKNAGWPEVPGFEILSELGRGGMGVVFRARQLSAGRLVALKVVRSDVLESMPDGTRASTLDRFRSEAQAAANLDHDNLVTVYEVGEANGVCYYAMRFVDGRSLADFLRDGPLDQRKAAGYLEPVCRALHQAHASGVLHRDLKPHNIMVDRRTDRSLLADFGLAKFVERSHELTHAGELLGTPAYMSPEQATDAASVTALADVYSMGATLYHLVTGRPPFQAASLTETIRQVVSQDPVAPRQLNAAIDRDVETICLKCLQKEPARRYASAEALADDLRRYLEGRPIVARPLGLVGRTWRRCRRNPWMAGLIVTAASFALVALVAIIVGYWRTAAALAESESRLDRALQVVDDLFTRVSEDELLNEPGMQPLRKDLLDRALKHYQYFLQESGGNPALRDGVADARYRVGVITQFDGARHDEALTELTAARRMQRALLEETPNDARRLKALADTLNALGNLHVVRRSFPDAVEDFTEAAAIRERLTRLDSTSAEYQRLLANVWMNLGSCETERRKFDVARGHLERAQETRESLLKTAPEAIKIRRDLAKGYFRQAALDIAQDQRTDAERSLRSAVEQFERVIAQDPRSLANRYDLSKSYRMLGALRAEAGDAPGAVAMFESASKPMLSLAVGNPDVSLYQSELAVLAMSRGGLYEDQGKLEAALAAWAEALGPLAELLAREPRNVDYRRDRAVTLFAVGAIEGDLARPTESRQHLEAARDLLQELVAELPKDERLAQQLRDVIDELSREPPPTPAKP